jgi:DNA polymerase-1
MSEKKPLLILIDGSSYLYRAFHALPSLTNSKGQPTGAVYGVLNMIRKLLTDYSPDFVAVLFDAKGKTFRDELYAEYKATRAAMPDDLVTQINYVQESIQTMGLPLISIVGVEADDVIATLATNAADMNMNVLISTGDKDIAQIVSPNITLINTMNNAIYDRQGVINKFGIPPELIVDYLALVGDNVDNIPGIPQVGPKTAVKWLHEYGSLDNLVINAEKITGKVGENLRSHLDDLELSRKLATVKKDVDCNVSIEELKRKDPDREKLVQLFQELEFKTWLAELLGEQEKTQKQPHHYKTILSEKDFLFWLDKLNNADIFSVDCETTSLNCLDAEVVGLSFSLEGESIYIPVAHDYPDAPKQLEREYVLSQLKPLLENHKIKKIGQNLKYDKNVLKNYDIDLQGIGFDTMLESYVLNSSGTRHDMDSLALKYLGKKTILYEEVAGKGAKHIGFSKVPIDVATEYAAEDADITLQLHHKLWPQIEKEPGLKFIFTQIEMPLMPVLANMECQGVLINKEKLLLQSDELEIKLNELQKNAYEMAGCKFNLNSPKQLQEILFTQLKLPVLEKTPTGQASTAESVLQELALDFPLPKVILEYRSLSKLKSTYIDALPKQIHPKTGRVHTSYNQAVAATGRLSSTDPNLQNIPVRTEEGRRIRQAFIAPIDYKIVAADYSQIELRIMAHLSGDKGLRDAFSQGLDIHRATAAEVFGIPLDKVTVEQRRSAKAINFGLIYGMSSYGLSKQINVEPSQAKKYMDLYFQRYPMVKNYMEQIRHSAHQQGYVETLFGRRLYLPEIKASNAIRRKAAERAAINGPMQGTAADIVKLAMIKMDAWLQSSDIKAHMIMQVHDELIFEVHQDDAGKLMQAVKDIMSKAAELSVPLVVDVGIGDNWDEAH